MVKQFLSTLNLSAICVVICSSMLAAKTISSTITVKGGDTYDGKGETIICEGMGDGGQSEGQKPAFKLERGANLKNVIIGHPGVDGIHCYGNNKLENVVWEDIGEEALTVKGSKGTSDKIEIIGGSAKEGVDKCFQINAACTFIVRDFTAENIGKLIRQDGGEGFKAIIRLENVTVINAALNIVRTDSKSTEIYCEGGTFNQTSQEMFMAPSASQVHDCPSKGSKSEEQKAKEEAERIKELEEAIRKAREQAVKDSLEKAKQDSSLNVPSHVNSKNMLFYNASTNTLVLSVPANDVVIEIRGVDNKLLFTQHKTAMESSTEFALPLQLPKGSYILKTTADGIVSTHNLSLYQIVR